MAIDSISKFLFIMLNFDKIVTPWGKYGNDYGNRNKKTLIEH
jgi:hypothetical protein